MDEAWGMFAQRRMGWLPNDDYLTAAAAAVVVADELGYQIGISKRWVTSSSEFQLLFRLSGPRHRLQIRRSRRVSVTLNIAMVDTRRRFPLAIGTADIKRDMIAISGNYQRALHGDRHCCVCWSFRHHFFVCRSSSFLTCSVWEIRFGVCMQDQSRYQGSFFFSPAQFPWGLIGKDPQGCHKTWKWVAVLSAKTH